MTKSLNTVLGLALVAALSAQPALAQKKDKKQAEAAPAAPAVAMGIGVANVNAAAVNSEAYRVAAQQRQTTYKASYDLAETKAKALEAQLKPLVDKFEADRKANKPEAALQQQYVAIQQFQERGKQEIQQALLPVAMSEAYVNEQIEEKMNQAIQTAMTKKAIGLLLQPGAVVARANQFDLTPTVVAELNALLPAAQLVPPNGWEPREIREARAQQAAQQAAASGAAQPAAAPAPRPAQPAGPQPDGR